MLSAECRHELRTGWLPHLTDSGLDRLIELLETGSPLLIQGAFVGVVPRGCLATHAAWHHPRTAHLTAAAGTIWLQTVAGIHPAASSVVRTWDNAGPHDWETRAALLAVLQAERDRRRMRHSATKTPMEAACL
jgi:hypothetical protein